MAKRSTDWTTVRDIVAVQPVSGRSVDITFREQGQRTFQVQMTTKSLRKLIMMSSDYLTLGDLDELQARLP